MCYTRSNGVRVPATVVGFAPDGLVHLEYFRDAVKVVNRQCKVESISFAIPSADSPPPHSPYFVTHFTDAMPISSIGGALSDILFNPKYAGCVWKITVAVDHLGNIVWICLVLPGTSADVKIWDTVITGAVRALCENAPFVLCRQEVLRQKAHAAKCPSAVPIPRSLCPRRWLLGTHGTVRWAFPDICLRKPLVKSRMRGASL